MLPSPGVAMAGTACAASGTCLWATLPDPSCRDCAGLHLPSTSAQGCPMSLHAADTDPVLLNMFYSWPGSWVMPGLC